MTLEKATYSYKKVYAACDLVKALNIDCKRKAEHFSIAGQIKEVTEKCYDLTGCILFDYEWNFSAQEYFKAAYNHKDHTKKALDSMGKAALRYLQNELTGILTMMKTGEVNSID